MILTLMILSVPFSLAYYSFKDSPIDRINQTVWKQIATGISPYIWMINFYCKDLSKQSANGQNCTKSYDLRNEYTDAVQMLKGIVRPAAFIVDPNFPAFVRVPCIMVYMPNSTEPYVYEMDNFPEQIKRPSFRLVHYIKDVILNHATDVEIRNVLRSWEINMIKDVALMKKIVNGLVANECYFVLIYDDLQRDSAMVQLMQTVATAIQKVHNLPETEITFGLANFLMIKEALVDWKAPYVAPKFYFFGPRNSPQNKQTIFSYDGRMDGADITRWVVNRFTDMKVIPGNAVQINVKRESGFVGQIIEIEKSKFYLATL